MRFHIVMMIKLLVALRYFCYVAESILTNKGMIVR
jgi:hypothetical protein